MTALENVYVPPANKPDLSERDCIMESLYHFISQRPGLEFGNYGDVSAYRTEMRSITKDLHHARSLLREVELRPSIGASELREAFRAFSGRLSWDASKRSLEYCTGQYFPTEYRKAACAVLASALWDYIRGCMPAPTYKQHGSARTESLYDGMSAGDWIRKQARIAFGASIARRWFN